MSAGSATIGVVSLATLWPDNQPMVTTTLGDRLRFLLAVRNKSKTALAAACEVSETGARKWFRGGRMSDESIALAATFLEVSPAQIRGEVPIPGFDEAMRVEATMAGEPVAATYAYRDPALAGFPAGARRVPVIAEVQAGPDGFFTDRGLPPGAGDGSIVFSTKDPNAYALRVRGESMRPRIRSGEFVVVEPNTPYRPGDDVVVALRDGRRTVKEFLYERDDEVSFRAINESFGDLTVRKSDIESIHFVGAIVPRTSARVVGEAD